MNYDDEIKAMEVEAKLKAQEHARFIAKLEIMKCKKRIAEMEVTIESLDKEILKTKGDVIA